MLWYVNKKPQWNEQVGAFVLNFGGRVTVASVKNFQLVSPEASHETEVLRFGKRAADEFALDLEHHSHRSYRGITCLMQLSTREEVRPQTTKRAQQRRPGAGARGVSAAHTRSRHRQW